MLIVTIFFSSAYRRLVWRLAQFFMPTSSGMPRGCRKQMTADIRGRGGVDSQRIFPRTLVPVFLRFSPLVMCALSHGADEVVFLERIEPVRPDEIDAVQAEFWALPQSWSWTSP